MATDDRPPFKCIGAGAGGVEEMQAHIDESTVQFALLKFVFGTGSFARTKLLFLHVNGESCSAVKRGRFNTKKGAAKTAAGSTHAELIVSERGEVTVDHILTELTKVIAADDMGEFHIDKMKEDYERLLAAAKMRKMSVSGSISRKRMTAAEMGSVPSHRAVEELRKPLGAFNWALFRGLTKAGELDFINAGSMSIHEMRDWLKDDEVSFGLLRMGFGTGRFRRIKYIFIHWSGESVSPVRRGRANAQEKDLSKALAPFAVEMHPTSLDEITLDLVIDKVRRASVVDGDDAESKTEDPFSVDNFMAALAEEQAANAEFFGESGEDGEDGSVTYDFTKTVADLHSHDGVNNWMLFEAM